MSKNRAWSRAAMQKIEADFNRSADTHLIRVEVPGTPDVHLYLKDEATHPTGSLKHRLARSLFLYGVCNGWIHADTTIVEASSGSTAISEAYFARLIGVPFVAVMPRTTSPAKIAQIEFYGGRCHLVDNPAEIYTVSAELAAALGGHFMDQFTYAERVTDWRGNNNIAESIFAQMAREPHPNLPGSFAAPAPAARRPPSAAMCTTSSLRRRSASSIPRIPFSMTTIARAISR